MPLFRKASPAVLWCILLAACANPGAGGHASTVPVRANLDVGAAAENAGDYQLAQAMYATASTRQPHDAATQLRYADLLVRMGDISAARTLLIDHMTRVSDPDLLRAGLAAVDLQSGNVARAIAVYDALLVAHPMQVRYIVNKAVALDVQGDHAAAQALYRHALTLTPGDPVILSDLALSLSVSGQTAAAAALVAPLRNDGLGSPRLHNDVNVVLAAAGIAPAAASTEQASAIASVAHALNPSLPPLAMAPGDDAIASDGSAPTMPVPIKPLPPLSRLQGGVP